MKKYTTMQQIGERIKSRRQELGLTATDLANKIGVHKSTIHHYEAGDCKSIKQSAAQAIADCLYVSSAWLLGETDDMTPEADAFLLQPTDKADICHIIEAARQLLKQDGLTFGGVPADSESIKTVSDGLTVVLSLARMQNADRRDQQPKMRVETTTGGSYTVIINNKEEAGAS